MPRPIMITVSFIASIGFAFWLIHFDEMIKAFIGFAIIAGWFYVFLVTCLEDEASGERKDEIHEP